MKSISTCKLRQDGQSVDWYATYYDANGEVCHRCHVIACNREDASALVFKTYVEALKQTTV